MVTQSINARPYQLRIRLGTSVRETIDLGAYGGGEGHFAEQAWLWATIKLLASQKEKEARASHKQTSALDRKRDEVIANVEMWMTEQGHAAKLIQQTISRMRRYDVSHASWDPFRDQFKGLPLKGSSDEKEV